jgi:alkaline phosphatase
MMVEFFRYEENNLKVGKKKTNIMFIGDGTGKTVITGKRSVGDGMTTFHTASFGKFKFLYHICLISWLYMLLFYLL